MPENVEAYIKFIRQLLQKSNYSAFIDKLCTSIERNNYKMSPKQYQVLERYRRGDNTPYHSKNEHIMNQDQLRKLIRERVRQLLENQPAPSQPKPDVAEPDTDTPSKPKPRRRTLTPPEEAPSTKPKASTNENEEELLDKIAKKYQSLKAKK